MFSLQYDKGGTVKWTHLAVGLCTSHPVIASETQKLPTLGPLHKPLTSEYACQCHPVILYRLRIGTCKRTIAPKYAIQAVSYIPHWPGSEGSRELVLCSTSHGPRGLGEGLLREYE